MTAKHHASADGDRDVWVVDWNPGGGWRTGAVLTSYDDAKAYREDLREMLNEHPDDIPEKFKQDCEVRIRHGSRDSPVKMFEEYPPS